ncbi:MAG TPA: type II secretion system F family protein [Hyphomicrobiaceae bacterium]|nr:type II secretion system F family protein [Hyphomicrobiaceae bacterium]
MDFDSDQMMMYGMLAVAAISVAVFIYVLMAPYLTGERRQEKRMERVTAENRIGNKIQEAASNRKKQVAETLKELEAKQNAAKKVTLRQQLQRSGLSIDVKQFYIASVIAGFVLMAASFVLLPTLNPLIMLAIGVIGMLGLPRWVLNKIVARRHAAFLTEFANSIDIIVRGVKSGLPLNECLNIIARESPDPVGQEFREVVDQQRVGVPLQECFERMMDRVPLAEVRFFTIVIAIQQSAGGNLSEALGNLSSVLRDRKAMQAKVKALSAEAKASAGVLAALPFIVMILVYLSTPDYIALLWQKKYGNFMLVGSAFWMFCGVAIMRKMINFKF